MKTEHADSGVSAVWAAAPARRFGLLSLVVLTLALSAPALAQPALMVDWTGGRLTVTAEEAPLEHVLGEVASRTGLRVRGAETLGEQVTVSFSGVTLGEGLRRLLARVNYVIVEQLFREGEVRPTLVLVVGGRLAGAAGAVASPGVGDDPATLTAATREEVPGERLDGFLADPNPAVRRWAVERLADVRDEWAYSRLMAALQDENAGVREGAVTALGPYGPEAIDPVATLLQGETYSEVRVAALQLLGQFGGSQLAGLFQGVLGDSDPRVRRAAVEGLAQAGGPAASEALRTAVLDQDVGVRGAALESLGIYGRDPKRAFEEALRDGDQAAQAVAAELMTTLSRSGLWDTAGPGATAGDVTLETVESPLEPR